MSYEPMQIGDEYVWQSAYDGAIAYDYILPADLWDRLTCYTRVEGSSLHKVYRTRRGAIAALHRAQRGMGEKVPFVGNFLKDLKELGRRLKRRRCS